LAKGGARFLEGHKKRKEFPSKIRQKKGVKAIWDVLRLVGKI